MELQIAGQNLEVTSLVRDYVNKRLGKLDRHLPAVTGGKVEIVEEQTKAREQRFVVQVTLDAAGTVIRGEERGGDLFTAVDKVADVLDRRLERFKGKLYDRPRKSGSFARGTYTPEPAEIPSAPKVVKRKQFPVREMTIDEAIDRMVLLGHDFFLFVNAENQKLGLLYVREDGNYGLIEPQVELSR